MQIIEATAPALGVLKISVSGRIRSFNTKVYKVYTIAHYTNLTGTLVHLEYAGKHS